MKRRGFFAALAALTSAKVKAKEPPTLVESADAHKEEWARVFIDGVEVTRDCYLAERYSDGSGIAFCYMRNEHDQFYAVGGDAARTTYRGQIRIERRPPGWSPGRREA